jgi:glutathione S-transferase
MILYDNLSSGNAYKVRLLLAHLGMDYIRVDLDIDTGDTRTPEYLKLNLNGRIPMLDFGDGRRLPESNAILFYCAQGSSYWPEDHWAQAQALQWMFFEQYNHEPSIAVSRYILTHLEADSPRRSELPRLAEKGDDALRVMEEHLSTQQFFAGNQYTIADIALYAYTHVADEGRFDLSQYQHIGAWLERCQAQAGHISITQV